MRKRFLDSLLQFDSIKKKLIFFVAAIAIISVMAGGLTSTLFSMQGMRDFVLSKMEITTQMVGATTEAALLFNSADDAREVLKALKKEREIVQACLYDAQGRLFADYIIDAASTTTLIPNQCPSQPEQSSSTSYEYAYEFRHTIRDTDSGEPLGVLKVLAYLKTLENQVAKQILAAAFIVLGVSILAFGAAYLLQPFITHPILSLVNLTRRISEERDYSLRAPTNSRDEIGALSSSFNHMLATIQEREKELYEINEKAESASRSKSEFLANMSHEIRTPINGILGFAQLLSVMELNEKQRSFVDIILSSGNSLLTVINDILDFSKIEAGKLHIETVPFNLQSVVEEVIGIMHTKAEEKHLELAVRVAPGTPTYVIGDPSRVKQILTNYVGNAIKFTENGHVMINAEARILGNTETIIRFEVIDTGIGISREAQKKIFDKFIQADSTTTKRYGGTGLGLAICQQLAHLMGGEVGLKSEPNKGSTFWFEVPFRLDNEQQQPSSDDSAALAGCRLLVVDDHEVNRRILLELSQEWNVEAYAAESGEVALHLLKKAKKEGRPFDIAILDYQLPNMDGEDLSNLIKTDRDLADTSLMLLTSMGMRGDAQKFQEIGFEAYLVKPARAGVLLSTLVTIWQNRQKAQQQQQIITRHTFEGEGDHRSQSDGSVEQRQPDLSDAKPITSPVPAPMSPTEVPPAPPPASAPPPQQQPETPLPPSPAEPIAEAPAAPAKKPSPGGEGTLEERMMAIVEEEAPRPKAATPPPPPPPASDLPPAATPSAPPAAETPPAPPAAPEEPVNLQPQEPLGTVRILLVEDQLTNRLVVENMLENLGLGTIHAENGQEAVEKVRAQAFDLVLMDVQMPVMNGYDATHAIRELEEQQGRARCPIIAVTANAMQGDREKCLEAGMDDYIAKPIQVAELQEKLKAYLPQGAL